jgi:autotransporter-associated beta strand protein
MRTSKQRSSKKFSLARLIRDQLLGRWQTRATVLATSTAALLGSVTASAQTLTLSTGLDTNIFITQTAGSPQIQNDSASVSLDGGADLRQALVKYDNLFGAGTNQIPIGATVLGAYYQVTTGGTGDNKSGDPFGIYRINTTMPDFPTMAWYNSFGADGVQVGGEANGTPDSVRSGGASLSTIVNFDVTSSLQYWATQADPNAANQGWMLTQVTGTDGWTYVSSSGAAANRPQLQVYYTTNTGLQNLTWNAATTSGTLDTVASNNAWSNPSSAPAAFRTGDTLSLSQDAASPVTITVANEAGGITPAATNVSHNSGTYTLTGGSINLTLNKTNAGTLVLASANNFNSVSLGGGVVELGANNALGSVGVATLSGGTILRPQTTQSTSKDFSFDNGTIEVANDLNFTLAGITYGSGTVNKTGTGTLTITSGGSLFTGTMDIKAGRVILSDPGNDIVTGGNLNATSILVRNGAAFQFGSATPISENPDLPNSTVITAETGGTIDWYIAEDFGGINLQGGTLNIGGGGPNIAAGIGIMESGTINGVGATRTLSVANGGQFNKATSGVLTLNNTNINATGIISVYEGTLSTDANLTGSGALFLGLAAPTTLQLTGSNPITMPKRVDLGSGGTTIEVTNADAVKTFSGNLTSSGALTKTGAGELRLLGTSDSGRIINVAAGRLSVGTGAITSGSTVTVNGGAALEKLTIGADSYASLTLGDTAGASLRLTLDNTVTAPLISVTNADGLIINGPAGSNNLSISLNGELALGTIPLIDYNGVLGGTGFAGLSLTLPPRTLGNLVNNTADTRIDFQVTGFDTLRWSGSNSGVWDINTTNNWSLSSSGIAATYLQNSVPGDVVTFGDLTSGATAVTLDTAVSPTSVTFENATTNYTLNGTGKISGATGLTKTGAGSVTIGTNNDFSGPVAVSAGSLALTGNNTLIGTITQTGGTLEITGASTLNGAVAINGGAATIGGGNTLNNTVTVSTGAQLTLNGSSTFTSSLNNTGGTLTVNGTNTVGTVNLTGGTTVIAANDALGATGTINLSNGAVLRGTGTITTARGLTATADQGGGTIDVQGTDVFSMTGVTAGTAPLTKTGTGTWEIMAATSSYSGTLDINAGSVVLQGSIADPTAGNFNASVINVKNGGRFQFGQTTTLASENPDLPGGTVINVDTGGVVDWNVGEDFGGMNINGGTVNLLRGGPNLTNASVDSFWTTGTINSATNQTFGSTNNGIGKIYKTGTETFTINGANIGSVGIFGIREGVLSTNGNFTGATGDLILGTSSTSGTLEFRNTASFSTAKPLVVDAGGGTISVTQAGTTATFTGAISNPTSGASGILTKTGAGRLLLSGANTSTGPIKVAQGTLAVSITGLSASSIVSVESGGTFEGPGTGTVTFAGLNLGTSGGANLLFDLTAASPTVAPVAISGTDSFAVNGTNSLTVKSLSPLTTGTYQLLDYTGSISGSSGFGGLNLVLPPRVTGNLVNNTTDTRLEVNITGADSIKWNGSSSAVWDIETTNNWKLASNGSATNYLQTAVGDAVAFDNTAAGNTNITLNTAVNPASVTFDNSVAYSISGTGSITGSTGIIKNGTGTVTIATNNTYTGVTTVNAGTLELSGNNTLSGGAVFNGGTLVISGTTTLTPTVNNGKLVIGNGGTTGAIGNGTITLGANGKLEFNRTDTTTLTNVFTGTGEIIHNSTGMTILSSNSDGFTGTVSVNAGTLRLANLSGTHNFNATSIVVNNGATFEFFGPDGNANLADTTSFVTVNAGGVVNWTEGETFGGVHMNGGTLNLTAAVTQNGASLQLTSGTINGAAAYGGSAKVIKTTSGTVTFNGAALNTNGGIDLIDGTISTDAGINANGTLTFGNATSRGTLQLRHSAAASIGKAVVVSAGGGVIEVQQAATAITSTGTLNAAANSTMVKTGAGELLLNGTATYGNNATLQVEAGTLSLNQTTAPTIGTSLNATVANGAKLNLGGTVNPLSNGTTHANVTNNGTLAATTAGKRVGSIDGTGTTEVTATGATLTASQIKQGTLSIGSGNSVSIATGGKTSTLNSLSIAGGTTPSGTLDLANNSLIVDDESQFATIRAQILNAYNGGDWNGTGIKSSSASVGTTAVGYATASDLGLIGGSYTDAAGNATNLTTDAVIVKYTYVGDSDLDGDVDADDFSNWFANYDPTQPTATGWYGGDFNYDGFNTADDFSEWFANFPSNGPLSSAEFLATAGVSLSVTAVPEPSAFVLGALAMTVGGVLLRRRRLLQGGTLH